MLIPSHTGSATTDERRNCISMEVRCVLFVFCRVLTGSFGLSVVFLNLSILHASAAHRLSRIEACSQRVVDEQGWSGCTDGRRHSQASRTVCNDGRLTQRTWMTSAGNASQRAVWLPGTASKLARDWHPTGLCCRDERCLVRFWSLQGLARFGRFFFLFN